MKYHKVCTIMIPSNFTESISIYYDNLSWFLIVTICVAVFGVILTICLQLQIPVFDMFDKITSISFANNITVKPKTKNYLNMATTSKESTLPEQDKPAQSTEASPIIEEVAHEEKSLNPLETLEFACGDDELSVSRLKTAKKNELLKEIQAKMTPQQQDEEEQIVNEQLSKIFALLKEQEEKFKVAGIGDLKEQLSLYK